MTKVVSWSRGSGLSRFSMAKKKEIRQAYESGLTLAAVARRFRASPPTISKAVRDAGGTIRSGGTPGVPS